MKTQATRLAGKLRKVFPPEAQVKISVVAVEDAVGGGSCPALPLPGWAVSVETRASSYGTGRLQRTLRARELPILCGAREDALMIHVRTLGSQDEKEILQAFSEIFSENFKNEFKNKEAGNA
jgi:seryl-tRNA(Sec) selenium transferase